MGLFGDAAAGAASGAATGSSFGPWGTVIGGGLGLLSGVFSGNSQASQNEKNRQFQLQMYNKQYSDAVNFWNMQNDYNSPSAQMARFKAAGLNPNLIYGQGTPGNASSPPPVPHAPTYQGIAPNTLGQGISGALSSLGNYYDLETKRAQVDNMKRQNELVAAQTVKTISDTTGSNLSNEFADKSMPFRLNKSIADYLVPQQVLQFNDEMNPLLIAIQRYKNEVARNEADASLMMPQQAKASLMNTQLQNQMAQFEVRLNKMGITKSDPEWQRIGAMFLQYLSSQK